MHRSNARLLILVMLVVARTGHAGMPRLIDLQMRAQIVEPRTGEVTTQWKDVLTDALRTETWSWRTNCVGNASLGFELTWVKQDDDSIRVTGPISFFEGRRCAKTERTTQQVDVLIPPAGEGTVTIDLRTDAGDTATGELRFRSLRPTCTGRHVRFRSTMRIVDDELIGEAPPADFQSRQISVFLEPGEAPGIEFRRCVDHEVSGILHATEFVIGEEDVRAKLDLSLMEGYGCYEDRDDRQTLNVTIPNAMTREIPMHTADDGNVVDATVTMENGGRQCWDGPEPGPIVYTFPPLASVPYIPLPIRPPDGGCTSMLRGCYVRADGRAGFVNVTGETCTGSGSSRRCTIDGNGQGLVCQGSSWTFRNAAVDPDCQGARISLQCLSKGAAILRVTQKASTIRREDRADTTALRRGKGCL
jgi:hypothetical protein